MTRRLVFVDEARSFWKWASVRLAAFASAVLAYLLATPEVAIQVLNIMPPETRAYLSPILGVALFLTITATRVLRKEPCDEPAEPAGE